MADNPKWKRQTNAERRALQVLRVAHVSKFRDKEGNWHSRTLARPNTLPGRAAMVKHLQEQAKFMTAEQLAEAKRLAGIDKGDKQ